MKLPLLFALAFVACSALAPAQQVGFVPTAELGKVMYVGDSITHGVDSASYRWALFKIWVDNGIAQQEVGVNAGNWRGGVARNTPYGGAVFMNVHAAISSQRAYEIAGRINRSGRLGNSNIHDWLGLDKGYEGKFCIDAATQMPDTFFLLIGTNDTLSDAAKAGIHSCLDATMQNLLGERRGKSWRGGDMLTIIRAMREANPGARIVVCTIPAWADGRHNNNAAEDFAAIARYNEALKSWARFHKLAVVEVNRGLVDVTRAADKPLVGVAGMFVRDRLHPSPQGDLIIAGNIAQQLGYAGRTAGLPRRAAKAFPLQGRQHFRHHGTKNGVKLAAGETLIYRELGAAGEAATVEFRLSKEGYGNGARGGWEEDAPLELTLCTTAGSGTLCLTEGAIRWGGHTLYSADMHALRAPIRLAYRPEDAARAIPGGFYVWLGDMLIGEALPAAAPAPDAMPGFRLSASCTTLFLKLSYEPGAAWAPASKRFSAAVTSD